MTVKFKSRQELAVLEPAAFAISPRHAEEYQRLYGSKSPLTHGGNAGKVGSAPSCDCASQKQRQLDLFVDHNV